MKHILGLVVICFGCSEVCGRLLLVPKEPGNAIKDVVKKCDPNVDAIEFSKTIQEGKYREDEDFKQLVFCSYVNSGYAHKDGRVNLEALLKLFSNDKDLEKAIKDCDKIGASPIETNWMSFKCFQDTSPVYFQIYE